MSGGEQQRVAVARALANSPRLLLADEPTGNLDPHTSTAVFENLYALARRTGVAAVVATHNLELARHMDRVFALKDGHLEATGQGLTAVSAGAAMEVFVRRGFSQAMAEPICRWDAYRWPSGLGL